MNMQTPIRHHIPDQIIAAYSAGTLDEAFSLVVASHASLCDECRAAIATYEVVGGAVLEDSQGVGLSDDALAATMALIEKGDREVRKQTLGGADGVFPTPLQEYIGGGPEAVKWQRLGRGVKQAIIPCKGKSSARLLCIPQGMAMPDHSHGGLELTMVLQGAFSDENDRFQRGDVETGDEDLWHVPVAEAGEDCICLAATDAPLRFKGLIPRLLQPLFRI